MRRGVARPGEGLDAEGVSLEAELEELFGGGVAGEGVSVLEAEIEGCSGFGFGVGGGFGAGPWESGVWGGRF